ncbi:MAG: endopeptidase, partial [Actinomycetota bacterium]
MAQAPDSPDESAFTAEQKLLAAQYQRRLVRGGRLQGISVAVVIFGLPPLADALDLPWRLERFAWVPILAVVVVVTHAVIGAPLFFYRLWAATRLGRDAGLSTASPSEMVRLGAKESLAVSVQAVVLAIPLYWVLRRWDSIWVMEAWGILGLYYLADAAIAPWRTRVVNGSVPTPESLTLAVARLAEQLKMRTPRVVVLDTRQLHSAPNALVSGVGPWRTIVVFEALLHVDDAERDAILLHEFGHLYAWDLERRAGFLAMTSITLALAINLIGEGFPFGSFELGYLVSGPGGYPAFATLWSIYAIYASLALLLVIGRRSEREADAFAVRASGDPRAFREAIRRISVANLSRIERGGLTQSGG